LAACERKVLDTFALVKPAVVESFTVAKPNSRVLI
jgi:hypothetical protein